MTTLIRKAAADAGFDIEGDVGDSWIELSVSGTPGAVWVRPTDHGAELALPSDGMAAEVGGYATALTPLSNGRVVVALLTHDELLQALRRVRRVLTTTPVVLKARFDAQLATVGHTEAEAVVKRRIGQDLFRNALLEYWEGRCAVTGIDLLELLRASHAKPWKDSDDAERLDVHNGLLLVAHMDALFDRGLLTFDAEGAGLVSERIRPEVRIALGFSERELRVRRLVPGHLRYLEYHRRHVFVGPAV